MLKELRRLFEPHLGGEQLPEPAYLTAQRSVVAPCMLFAFADVAGYFAFRGQPEHGSSAVQQLLVIDLPSRSYKH